MNRIHSVDFFRVIAMLFVIAIHTRPFSENTSINFQGNNYMFILINQLSRFAVPFFFIISGYFYGFRIHKGSSVISITKKMATRIAIIYISWNLIYIFSFDKINYLSEYGINELPKFIYLRIQYLIKNPINLVFQGTSEHLWFLFSLLLSIITTGIFIKYRLNKLLLSFAVIFYIIGVLAKSYINTPLGIPLPFNTRNGIFFSLLLFVSGYKIASIKFSQNKILIGILIFTAGLIFHFLELYFLNRYFSTTPMQDFVFGTYFMGLGTAIISLSNHSVFNIKFFDYLGKKTLGIYGIHFMLIILLKPIIIQTYHPLLEICFPIIIYMISMGVVIIFSKNHILKRIVE